MFCRQCGYNNDKYTRMCRRCGSDLYTAQEEQGSMPEPQNGRLLRERPRHSIIDDIKQLFVRRRRYITMSRRTKYIIAACAAGALLLALMVWGTVSCVRSCNQPPPDYTAYTESGNIAHGSRAVSDGEYIYYCEPMGDNPGLYRVPVEGGERTKLSYRRMTGLACVDGYIYGTDTDTGCYIRISVNGLDARTVLEFEPQCVNFVGDRMYFLSDGSIYTAEPGGKLPLEISPVYTGGDAKCLTVSANDAYFIRVSPGLTDAVAAAAGLECGLVSHLSLETGALSVLHETPADMLTVYGEYLFFAVGATAEVQVVEESDDEDEDKDEDENEESVTVSTRIVDCMEFRRLNTVTGECVIFLSPNISVSPLNVTSHGVYFIGTNGGIERVPFGGGDPERIPAFETNISGVTVVENYLYFGSEANTRLCCIRTDGSDWELLCRALDYQLVVSDSDVPGDTI